MASEIHTYAVVVGSNPGGEGQSPLKFAEQDAQRLGELLSEIGRYRSQNVRVLLSPQPREVLGALDALAEPLSAHRDADEQAVVFFYYSGHARASAMNLGDGELMLSELRQRLLSLPTTLTIVVLDACQSGAFSRIKGAEPAADDIDCGLLLNTDHRFYRKCMSPRLYGTGHNCYKDSECTSGFCLTWFEDDGSISPLSPFPWDTPQPSLCHECRTDSDCDSERICGLFHEDFKGIARCVEPGSDRLGETCRGDSECAEGLFCVKGALSGLCGECDENTACENGLLCSYAYECIEPRTLAIGESCKSDDFCESGICSFPPPDTPGPVFAERSGWCAECADDNDCEQGQSCVDSYEETEQFTPTCWPRE